MGLTSIGWEHPVTRARPDGGSVGKSKPFVQGRFEADAKRPFPNGEIFARPISQDNRHASAHRRVAPDDAHGRMSIKLGKTGFQHLL